MGVKKASSAMLFLISIYHKVKRKLIFRRELTNQQGQDFKTYKKFFKKININIIYIHSSYVLRCLETTLRIIGTDWSQSTFLEGNLWRVRWHSKKLTQYSSRELSAVARKEKGGLTIPMGALGLQREAFGYPSSGSLSLTTWAERSSVNTRFSEKQLFSQVDRQTPRFLFTISCTT